MDEETIAEMIAIIAGITVLVVLIASIAVAWIHLI